MQWYIIYSIQICNIQVYKYRTCAVTLYVVEENCVESGQYSALTLLSMGQFSNFNPGTRKLQIYLQVFLVIPVLLQENDDLNKTFMIYLPDTKE